MSQEKSVCCFCRLPRATFECEVCSEPVCRSCVLRLPEETFAMLPEKPAGLCHDKYCPRCHDEHIETALTTYNEIMERAKNVGYWAKGYRGHVPVLKKARFDISVENGLDRDDVLLRLGFKAAQAGFNGLIQGEVTSAKVRNFGYQKMTWSASALPCMVDDEKLAREEYREAHWRILHHR